MKFLFILLLLNLSARRICMTGRCLEGDFMCGGPFYNCISKEFICDGQRDCSDSSDETSNLCQHRSCNKVLDFTVDDIDLFSISTGHYFRCQYGACIPVQFRCDGVQNCLDGSDEAVEICMRKKCRRQEHRCKNGGCIAMRKICNGRRDCLDGSDETNDLCSNNRRKCHHRQFRCDYGACIYKNKKCDGKSDCADGSDESGKYCEKIARENTQYPSTNGKPQSTRSLLALTTSVSMSIMKEHAVTTESIRTKSHEHNTPTELLSSVVEPTNVPANSVTKENSLLNKRNYSLIHVSNNFSLPFNPTSSNKKNNEYSSNSNFTLNDSLLQLNITENQNINCPEFQCFCPKPIEICIPCNEFSNLTIACNEISRNRNPCSISALSFDTIIEVISCGENDFYQNCISINRVAPSTLAFGDCWSKYTDIWRCQSDGYWSSNVGFSDNSLRTRNICQFSTLNSPICGKLPYVKRNSTISSAWPFLVGIFEDKKFSCTGTLISTDFVLTAAHCVSKATKKMNNGDDLTLKIELSTSNDEEHRVEVSNIFLHPNFTDYVELHNDVALIKLRVPVILSEHIVPACVAIDEVIFNPMALVFQRSTVASKWTIRTSTIDLSCFNKESKCSRHLSVHEGEFCARYLDREEDSLERGSSGGPYLVNMGTDHYERWTLGGILSHVIHTSDCPFQLVYSDLSYSKDWILNCIEGINSC